MVLGPRHAAAREFGRTIVIMLHDINFVARYADYICATTFHQDLRYAGAGYRRASRTKRRIPLKYLAAWVFVLVGGSWLYIHPLLLSGCCRSGGMSEVDMVAVW